MLLCGAAWGRQEAGGGPAARLGELTRAEQGALDAGDEARILLTGRQLGGLALRLMGDLEAGREQFALAAEAYGRSLAVEGQESQATGVETGVLLVAADLRAGRKEAAAEVSERVVTMAGEGPQIHMLLANARHSAGDLPGTIAELQRAIAMDGQFGAAHMALGEAFWELNEYQYNLDSLREFLAAQRASPGDFFGEPGSGRGAVAV